jgi:ligand-binding SRPBCC domain-containing protein
VKSNEEAIEGVTSGLIGLNQTVTWRARHFGIYHRLTSKINQFTSPTFFVDEMLIGPFNSMRHEHHFSKQKSQVIMKDVFQFRSPYGILGRLVDKLVMEKHLTALLTDRNTIIKQYAENLALRNSVLSK